MKSISTVNYEKYCVIFSVRLSPEVFLKRPATDKHWRLDEILKRKAVGIPLSYSSLILRMEIIFKFHNLFPYFFSPLFEPSPSGTRSQSVCFALQRGGAGPWHQ